MDEKTEIKKLYEHAKDYFGDDEDIFIYKCKKCKKLDPVPGFVVGEQIGFLRFIGKKKSIPKMECPYCNGTMLPIDIDFLK